MKLSVIILAKNEEKNIKDCLELVKWADEIVLVDTGATDKTPEIAKRFGVKITKIVTKELAFAKWRNKGLKKAQGEWVFYVDPDERVTPELKKEIQAVIKNPEHAAYAIPRKNYLLGKELRWGGWSPDYVKRLFLRKSLEKWVNDLHEEPVFEGSIGKLKQSFIHLQPEKIEPMLQKSIKWSELEAKMLLQAKHPPVVWWRILRMGLTTLFNRLILKQGFRDGAEGWIQSIYQAFHSMIVYIQLWEKQQKHER